MAGQRTSSPYRDSSPDINDYWDGSVPAPHRLSGTGSPYPTLSRPSTSSYNDPFRNPPSDPSLTSSGPRYAPVGAPIDLQMSTYNDHTHDADDVAEHTPMHESFAEDGRSGSRSAWLEKEDGGTRRSKWILWGAVGLGGLLIIGGIIAGIVISQTHGNAKNNSSNNNSGGSGSNSSVSGDPSKFDKNSALKQSFYGFGYTPIGAILPDCGATLDGVIEDIQILSQLTTRIRTYGSDCNVSSMVLDAIQLTKVNLDVFLGIFVNDNDTVYERQRDLTKEAIQAFGVDHVAGITVGNEFILNNLTAAGSSDPTSTVGIAAAEFLKTKIADVRSTISGLSLSKTIPIGTADAGSYFNTDIIEAVDYCMANVHPWFASTTIDDAANWTANFFQTQDVDLAKNTTNNPQFYIAETGWPTNSSTAAAMQNGGGAAASVANLQTFLNTFVCQANTNSTGYFYFEFMDEPWKTVTYGGVEGYWGLFDSNKKLKNVTVPDCSHS